MNNLSAILLLIQNFGTQSRMLLILTHFLIYFGNIFGQLSFRNRFDNTTYSYISSFFFFSRKEILEIPHKTGLIIFFFCSMDIYLLLSLENVNDPEYMCSFSKGSRQDSVRYATCLERIILSVQKPAWKRWGLIIMLCISICIV